MKGVGFLLISFSVFIHSEISAEDEGEQIEVNAAVPRQLEYEWNPEQYWYSSYPINGRLVAPQYWRRRYPFIANRPPPPQSPPQTQSPLDGFLEQLSLVVLVRWLANVRASTQATTAPPATTTTPASTAATSMPASSVMTSESTPTIVTMEETSTISDDPLANWISVEGCRYMLFHSKITWEHAKMECEKYSSKLAHVNLKRTVPFDKLLRAINNPAGSFFWVGLSDADSLNGDDDPVWLDGMPLDIELNATEYLTLAGTPGCGFYTPVHHYPFRMHACGLTNDNTPERYLCEICP